MRRPLPRRAASRSKTLYNRLKKGEDPEMYPEHAAFHEAYRKAEATAEDTAIEAIPVLHSPATGGRQDPDVTSEVQPIRTIMVVRTVSAEEDEK
jgi:hypothetical protein